MGDCQSFAQKAAILANNRELTQSMSTEAAAAGLKRFTPRHSASAYAK